MKICVVGGLFDRNYVPFVTFFKLVRPYIKKQVGLSYHNTSLYIFHKLKTSLVLPLWPAPLAPFKHMILVVLASFLQLLVFISGK